MRKRKPCWLVLASHSLKEACMWACRAVARPDAGC
ncbi:Acb2/Tad1 domain-containing protein [Salmonella enterica]